MAAAHIDRVVVHELHTFSNETLFHHFGMPKSPSATQETLAIHHTMKGQLAIRRWTGNRPSDLPGSVRLAERASDVAVGRYAPTWNPADDLENRRCPSPWSNLLLRWFVHLPLQRAGCAPVKPNDLLTTLYSPVRRLQRRLFDLTDDHHPKRFELKCDHC